MVLANYMENKHLTIMNKEQIKDCDKTILVHYINVSNMSPVNANRYLAEYTAYIKRDDSILNYVIPIYGNNDSHIDVFRSNQETIVDNIDEYLKKCKDYIELHKNISQNEKNV